MSGVAGGLARVASGIGAVGGVAVALAAAPTLLIPMLVILAPFATLPLLVTVLALVAVYDPKAHRRAAAARILDRLLITLPGGRRPGR